MHLVTGLSYVLEQPLSARLAKTKADIAKKSSHSYSFHCVRQFSILTCTPAFSAFTTKVLVAAVEQGLLALPRVFFSSFDKSVHNKAGGGDGDAWAFKLS